MHPPPPKKNKTNKKQKKKQITNKCLNICELVEMAKRNRDNPLPFPAVL